MKLRTKRLNKKFDSQTTSKMTRTAIVRKAIDVSSLLKSKWSTSSSNNRFSKFISMLLRSKTKHAPKGATL